MAIKFIPQLQVEVRLVLEPGKTETRLAFRNQDYHEEDLRKILNLIQDHYKPDYKRKETK